MKAIVLLSGGMDSSVLLAHVKALGHHPIALNISYGQRHWRECLMSHRQANEQDVPWRQVQLPPDVLHSTSSSQSGVAAVPEGHYSAENMKTTIVPNRNMVFMAVAVSRAIAEGAGIVYYAAHSGDHAIYPDCRADFFNALHEAVKLCDWNPPRLEAPFLTWTKAEIVSEGVRLGVNFEMTRTCYNDGIKACGRCGTCVERLEAFALAGHTDPIQYADYEFWRTTVKGVPGA